MARTEATWQQEGTYVRPTEYGGANVLVYGVNRYLNFGTASGETGYGIRDNGGSLEIKNSGGSWVGFSGSGINRSVVVTSGNTNAGNTASTDYVYVVAGAHTVSLPAASGNTSRYTIKNSHSADITVDTVGAETIDGTASITIAPEDSVDIISDGTNFIII